MEQDDTDIYINWTYVNHFQTHIAEVASHLNGADNRHGRMVASYFPPCGYWSPADKDRFFHALSVHSRLRPDLIAAEIPGKTTADVCVYLDLLSEAVAREPKKWNRSKFPSALEVSDEWIGFEEEQARAIVVMEPTWEAQQREDKRAASLRAEKRVLRKDNGDCTQENRKGMHERRGNMLFRELQAKKEAEWDKDDYMGDLHLAHLRVIDSIFREAEESFMDVVANRDSRETSQDQPTNFVEPTGHVKMLLAGHPVPQAIPAQAPPSDPYSASGSSQEFSAGDPSQTDTLGSGTQSSSVIGEAETDFRDIGGRPAHNLSDALDNVDLGNLSPRSRRRYQKRLYMRRRRAAQSGSEAVTTIRRLKPGRKTNKKLLREEARQRAALLENGDVLNEVNLSDASFTLPPEQEDEKKDCIDVHAGKEEIDVSLGPDRDGEPSRMNSPIVDGGKQFSDFHPHLGGRTRPYKIKKTLVDFGYDAQTLGYEGLGLFHLSKLADLMSLHASLQDTEPDIGTRISAPLIKLLHAEVVCFVTDLMHRAIVIYEQQRELKKHTKVWRMGGNRVKPESVHQALETLGAAKDKNEHFTALLSQTESLRESMEQLTEARDTTNEADRNEGRHDETLDLESNNDEQEDGEDDESCSASSMDKDVDREEQAVENAEPVVPLHREIYAPFMWHPSLDHLDPSPFSPSEGSLAADKDNDSLDVSDDSKLIDELLEEEELDIADQAAAKEAEEELQAEVAFRKTGEESQQLQESQQAQQPQQSQIPEQGPHDAEQLQKQSAVRHKRRPRNLIFGTAKRVKSSVYIEDSD